MRDQDAPAPRKRSALLELTRSRMREFYREPGAVFWTFGFPVVMAIALGLAFRNTPPPKARVAVHEHAPAWVMSALKSERFEARRVTSAEAVEHLRRGISDLVVLPGDKPGTLSYQVDERRQEALLAKTLTDEALQAAQGRTDPVATTVREVDQAGTRYVDFLMSGLIGLNIMGSSMWGIGYSVVVARKRRLLRRFAASPLHHSHFLGAYGLSRLCFLGVELFFLIVFGRLAFDVTIQGSVLAYAAVALIGAASFSALSLLIAARIESIEAANGWLNFVMLPMWLLSGSFFSYERFPEVMLPFIKLLPLTALNDALRAIANQGVAVYSTWPQLAVLSVWGVVGFLIAMKRFRWQ